MERSAIHNLLFSEIKSGKEITVAVVGISMNPTGGAPLLNPEWSKIA